MIETFKDYWNSLNTVKRIRVILTLIAIVLMIVFAVQNWDRTTVSLIFFSIQLPITLLILVAMICGYFIASFYHFKKIHAKEKEIRALKAKLDAFMKDQGDSL